MALAPLMTSNRWVLKQHMGTAFGLSRYDVVNPATKATLFVITMAGMGDMLLDMMLTNNKREQIAYVTKPVFESTQKVKLGPFTRKNDGEEIAHMNRDMSSFRGRLRITKGTKDLMRLVDQAMVNIGFVAKLYFVPADDPKAICGTCDKTCDSAEDCCREMVTSADVYSIGFKNHPIFDNPEHRLLALFAVATLDRRKNEPGCGCS
ncbi:hypothetical protein DIPPA_05793 [Diplonema papillatum]|nr:hypothetical protein DIPPA_05793 [Diplonema papillatum]